MALYHTLAAAHRSYILAAPGMVGAHGAHMAHDRNNHNRARSHLAYNHFLVVELILITTI